MVEAWDVQDDLLLRDAVEQGASLAALAAGAVTFSRTFTEEEVTERWRTLLFDGAVARAAAVRMAAAERAAPPAPATGDDMLSIVTAWRSTRAAAAGEAGGAAPAVDAEHAPSFSEVEDALMALGPKSLQLGKTWSDRGTRVEARAGQQRDLALLQSLERASRAATDRAAKGALATLRGVSQRWLMRKPEVLIGRSTDDQKVDIDLSLEGNASKVSRQHAFIQLRKDGKFYVRNIGRRAVLVNNAPVESGQRALLPPDCLLEIGGLRLVFMPNARRTRPKASPRAVSPATGEPQASGGDATAMEAEDTAAAAPPAEPAAEPAAPPASAAVTGE